VDRHERQLSASLASAYAASCFYPLLGALTLRNNFVLSLPAYQQRHLRRVTHDIPGVPITVPLIFVDETVRARKADFGWMLRRSRRGCLLLFCGPV
jgi:hypothetical protein